MTLDRSEVEAFDARQRRLSRLLWLASFAIAVASGFLIGELWSFVIGIPVAAMLAVTTYEVHKSWNRKRWVRRFPELDRDGVVWEQRSRGWRI